MKKAWNYRKIKWTAFFTTVFVLGTGLTVLYMMQPKTTEEKPQTSQESEENTENAAGYYSNEAFGTLIESNLAELGFAEEITFRGESEGQFVMEGALSEPDRLIAVCGDLKPYSTLLNAIKGETVTIKGHIGENDEGNGCFVTDTITFSGYTLSAAVATSYIEEYTGLNDLLEVPYHQISLSESGITFQEELPAVIQIASYNSQASAPSASQ